MTDTDVLFASIGAAHGIKGEVRVKSFTDDPLGFADYGKLHDENGKKYQVIKARISKNVVVTRFKSIDTREKAEALNGIQLYVDRSVLPESDEEDEFYVTDLIGMDVLDADGNHIGAVMAVPNFGADDMLEISPLKEGGGLSAATYYLPFTKEVVPNIDIEKAALTVVPPLEVSERDADVQDEDKV